MIRSTSCVSHCVRTLRSHSSLQIQSNAVFEGQVKHADDPLKDTAPKAAAAANESKPLASSGPAGYGISPSAS